MNARNLINEIVEPEDRLEAFVQGVINAGRQMDVDVDAEILGPEQCAYLQFALPNGKVIDVHVAAIGTTKFEYAVADANGDWTPDGDQITTAQELLSKIGLKPIA
jgi:hypothetical protein